MKSGETAELRKSTRVKRARTFSDDYVNEVKVGDSAVPKSSKIRKVEPEKEKVSKEVVNKKAAPLGSFCKSLSAMKPNRNREKEASDESDSLLANTSVLETIEEEKKVEEEKIEDKVTKEVVEVPMEVEAVKEVQVSQETVSAGTSQTSITQPSQSTFNASSVSAPQMIGCKFAGCTKTFRKQSLLDYHIKYHHYEDGRVIEGKNRKRKQSVDGEESVKKVKDSDLSGKKSSKGDAEDLEEPYEVISCKCGRSTSDGFMIQCEQCFCWQHGDCMNISENNLPQLYVCWVCEEHREPKRKDFNFENWLTSEKLNEVNPRAKQFFNDCAETIFKVKQMKYSYECVNSLIE